MKRRHRLRSSHPITTHSKHALSFVFLVGICSRLATIVRTAFMSFSPCPMSLPNIPFSLRIEMGLVYLQGFNGFTLSFS